MVSTIQQSLQQTKAFKHTNSLRNLRTKAQITTQLTKQIVVKASDLSTYFSVFLANSKGKDKFLALFQYLFQFICTCCKHSCIQEYAIGYKKKQLLDMSIYYNIKENISSARKVFRLLRFLDQIKGLSKILKTDKPILFKLLSAITYFFSCMYYISDNSLWLIGIMVRSGAFEKSVSKSWKYRKNFFSLCRIIFYLIILVYSIYLQHKDSSRQLKLIKDSIGFQNQFDSDLSKLTLGYISGRRKMRFLYLEMCLSLFRLLMLISSLRLAGHQRLDPIFVGWCGLGSAILGFLKALYQKKIVLNLDKKPQNNDQHTFNLTKIDGVSTLKLW